MVNNTAWAGVCVREAHAHAHTLSCKHTQATHAHIFTSLSQSGSDTDNDALMDAHTLHDTSRFYEFTNITWRTTTSAVELGRKQEVVVYDQSSKEAGHLSKDGFVHILMGKLEGTFHKVSLLTVWSADVPDEHNKRSPPLSLVFLVVPHFELAMRRSQSPKHTLTTFPQKKKKHTSSISVPAFLLFPRQQWQRIFPRRTQPMALAVVWVVVLLGIGITYVLNASNTCPKPDFISESHFMRIPVNDNYCEKLLPWLDKTNEFIDKAKVSNCRVIVHCLAGISRSATIAIAYIMKTMGLSSDDAYRFVKDRRPSISPNFNFLGQLLEFEKGLRLLQALTSTSDDKISENNTKQSSELNGVKTGFEMNGHLSNYDSSGGEPHIPPEPKLPSPTSLQQGFNGLHLSAERIMDTNRLKRSFSLDIKSVYSPNSPSLAPTHSEDVPKLCKLDSPGTGTSNGVCSQSPVLDSPSSSDSPFPSPGSGGSIGGLGLGGNEGVHRSGSSSSRPRRKPKHSSSSSPIHSQPHQPPQSLSLSLDKSPSLDENLKGSLLLSLPSLPNMGSGAMWTKHRDTVQATTPVTPVTPTTDAPWHFGAEEGGKVEMELGGGGVGGGEESTVRFGSSSAYVAVRVQRRCAVTRQIPEGEALSTTDTERPPGLDVVVVRSDHVQQCEQQRACVRETVQAAQLSDGVRGGHLRDTVPRRAGEDREAVELLW
ncbi:Dual specificity protein phosphatase 8 [Collichthys lucidus]|uniref:protein-tyrosine-phosphatase n=1 Tax=Collichthys lucidus TaxID=240159 RepID=A0A4U5UGI2_COLLU|nr:Dual specificity protein phosphatase 8 [Collichthys lucidus]